jgi:hypothetical protein
MMKRAVQLAAVASALASGLTAGAALVGSDRFDYPDGSIDGGAGGVGWSAERTDEPGAPPPAPSDWDMTSEVNIPRIIRGTLVTIISSADREYNGPSAGATAPSNEREGAFRGTGTVFYGFDMSREPGAGRSGASSVEFGAERVFFGVPGDQDFHRAFFGIEETGVGRTLGTVPVIADRTYRLVTELDFDGDQLKLWVDPTPGDESRPDVTRPYTGTNWSTAVRLSSESAFSAGAATWDNLAVGTRFSDVVPEPTTAAWLVGIGALALLRRRR